jgi:hypothetical protein
MKKSPSTGKRGAGKDLDCRVCKRKVRNVDSNATSVLCWRCVAKDLNPNSMILSDLSRKELDEFFKKVNKQKK